MSELLGGRTGGVGDGDGDGVRTLSHHLSKRQDYLLLTLLLPLSLLQNTNSRRLSHICSTPNLIAKKKPQGGQTITIILIL